MSGIAGVASARSHYNPDVDVLEIEFGDLKRTTTIAYEDLILLHFGTQAGEFLLQGVSFIGFQRIRERIHGGRAGNPEVMAREFEELVRNLVFEAQPDGKIVIKDARHWDKAFGLRTRITSHLELVHDVRGDPLGIVIDNVNGLDEAAIQEFFDFIFSAILPTEEDEKDPVRLAAAKRVAARWAAPFLATAA